MNVVDLGRSTWTELAGLEDRLLLVPIGSTEQHGPHLPLDTDTRIAVAVVDAVARRRRDIVAGPTLPFGSSGEHAGFPGTLSIGRAATEEVVVELVRSADAWAGVVLVNGHGGNAEPVERAARRLAVEGRQPLVWWAHVEGGDPHAGRTETSLMLAIAPELVRLERAEPGNGASLDELVPMLVAHGVRAVSPNGVLGDPTGASAQEGGVLMDGLVDDLDAAIVGLAAVSPRRVALVTGAARGIGAAIVRRLALDGWAVVAVDLCRDDPAVPYPLGTRVELDAVVAAAGSDAVAVEADVRSADDVEAAVARATDHFGGLDAVVAAAGVLVGGPPAWTTAEKAWQVQLDVNLTGVWRLAVAAVPALLDRPEPRRGRFVAISSVAGIRALPQLAGYSASKHGVIGLTTSLAAELGPHGITANVVCPGSTATPILDASAAVYDLADSEEFARYHVLGRLLEPDEVAVAVAFLCHPDASGITGAVIPVDAGMSAT